MTSVSRELRADSPDSGMPRAQDHWRVNLAEAWEVAFWSREFGCTEAELRKAVESAGSSAGAVRACLAQAAHRNNF